MPKKKMKELPPLSLRQARTEDEVCSLRFDNYSTGHHWILAGESTVTIAKQTTGEKAKAMIEMPKADFNKLIDAYLRPQKRKRAKP